MISREFDTKEDAMKDREVAAARCFLCEKNVRKKIRWFSVGAKNQCCLGYCGKHGFIKGKIRMKRAENGQIYVVKTMKLVDEEEAAEVRNRQEELKKKRREKRKQAKKNESAGK